MHWQFRTQRDDSKFDVTDFRLNFSLTENGKLMPGFELQIQGRSGESVPMAEVIYDRIQR